MIVRATGVAIVIALSGCAAKVTQSTPRTVMVNAGTTDGAGALQAAQAECAKQGRNARLNKAAVFDRQWVFDCVE